MEKKGPNKLEIEMFKKDEEAFMLYARLKKVKF